MWSEKGRSPLPWGRLAGPELGSRISDVNFLHC